MYARSTTVRGDPDRLDDGIAYVRDDVMPSLVGRAGCVGLSMLVDRDSGLAVVTSSWDSEDAMRASDLHLAPMRMRGGRVLGGPPEVEVWDVAVMHRERPAPEGARCRVTWLRVNRGDVERGLGLYTAVMLPEMRDLPGFCSASLLVDRASGRACNTTTYEGPITLAATRERAWAIRETGLRDAGVDVLDVAECELVLAHLRVPELV